MKTEDQINPGEGFREVLPHEKDGRFAGVAELWTGIIWMPADQADDPSRTYRVPAETPVGTEETGELRVCDECGVDVPMHTMRVSDDDLGWYCADCAPRQCGDTLDDGPPECSGAITFTAVKEPDGTPVAGVEESPFVVETTTMKPRELQAMLGCCGVAEFSSPPPSPNARVEFEAWATSKNQCLDPYPDIPGQYALFETQLGWAAWQAATARVFSDVKIVEEELLSKQGLEIAALARRVQAMEGALESLPEKLLAGGECGAHVHVVWDGCSSKARDTRALQLLVQEHVAQALNPEKK